LDGRVLERTFKSGDKVDTPDLEEMRMQYLYNDGESYHFMNADTYEQYAGPVEAVGDTANMMKENAEVSILFFNGKDIRTEAQRERTRKAELIVGFLQKAMNGTNYHSEFKLIPTLWEDADAGQRQEFYNVQVARGDEGVIAKDVEAPYAATKNRTNYWIKLKKSVNDHAKMAFGIDSIDAFVTGFELGKKGKKYEHKVKILKVSTWITDHTGQITQEEPHEIAHITNFDDGTINDMTYKDPETGEIDLNPR
jgi:hypothetical protein